MNKNKTPKKEEKEKKDKKMTNTKDTPVIINPGYGNMKEENDSEMVITNLKSIIQNAEALLGLVQNGSAMPEWAEAKVTLAQDYIMSAKDFISAEMMEELEQVGEVYKGMKTTAQLRQAIAQGGSVNAQHFGFLPSFSDKKNKEAIDAAKRALGPKGGKVTGIPDSHKHLYKEEMELVNESMKLIKTHNEGPHSAKVYKDSDWGEYRVKYYKNGVHQSEADSHHDDAKDAHDTAKFQLKKMSEELEQTDKNLKRFAESNQISDKLLETVKKVLSKENNESEDPDDEFAKLSRSPRSPSRGLVKRTKDGEFIATNDSGSTKIFSDKEAAEKHASNRK